jgi:hypothetical protein
MTSKSEVAARVAGKLAGIPYVGQRVRLFSGKTGTITEVGPTGAEVQIDNQAAAYFNRSSGYFRFDYLIPL